MTQEGTSDPATAATDKAARLHSLVGRYSRFIDSGLPLGVHGTLRFMCFIDLLSAAHVRGDLALMADCLVDEISTEIDGQGVTVIASPKRGNVLLGYAVAEQLALKSLFVRDEILASHAVEGIYNKRDKVILIDDVSSDGELLADAVLFLRQEGLNVEGAFTVINRSDGDAERKLAAEGIALKSVLSVNDALVEDLMAAQKSGSNPSVAFRA